MRGVPWWGLAASAAAPVLLITGWTVAASLQPRPFDPVEQSVSALAASGARYPWVMSLAFVLAACCYMATGIALRPAGPAGRAILVTAGVAGVFVAFSPQPADGAFSLAHAFWAATGLVLLAVWPMGAVRRIGQVPWGLRAPESFLVTAVLGCLLVWFLLEIVTGGQMIGLAERVAGESEALWPLTVVLSCRLTERRALRGARGSGLTGATESR